MFFPTLQMMCWRSSQFSSWCSLPPSVFGVAMTAAARGPSSSPLRCCAQPVVPACAAVASASTREQSGVEQRAEGRAQRADGRAQQGAAGRSAGLTRTPRSASLPPPACSAFMDGTRHLQNAARAPARSSAPACGTTRSAKKLLNQAGAGAGAGAEAGGGQLWLRPRSPVRSRPSRQDPFATSVRYLWSVQKWKNQKNGETARKLA